MSDVTITERQQYWLDHIRAAAAFDGNLAEYARSAGLKPKELYSWKGILRSRGLLDQPAASSASGFVRVIAPARPSDMSLVPPNGNVRYPLKTPYRDGTTHVIFEPLDFIARLAALVPMPRATLTRFHGVFAPNSSYRARVTPARRGRGSQHTGSVNRRPTLTASPAACRYAAGASRADAATPGSRTVTVPL